MIMAATTNGIIPAMLSICEVTVRYKLPMVAMALNANEIKLLISHGTTSKRLRCKKKNKYKT